MRPSLLTKTGVRMGPLHLLYHGWYTWPRCSSSIPSLLGRICRLLSLRSSMNFKWETEGWWERDVCCTIGDRLNIHLNHELVNWRQWRGEENENTIEEKEDGRQEGEGKKGRRCRRKGNKKVVLFYLHICIVQKTTTSQRLALSWWLGCERCKYW